MPPAIRLTGPILAAGLGLAACTPTTDYSPDPYQRTKEGAAVGALVGGLGGLVVGEGSGDVVRGALVGGVVGGVVGASLDAQARELQRAIGHSDIDVINTGEELIVRMPQDILFAFDSDLVRPALQADVAVLADSLLRYPDTTVEVIGHTDDVGTAAYNLDLSTRRASAVALVLVAHGVPAGRLRTIGRGEDAPVASNLSESGRAQNRRVEVVIRPTA